MRDACGGIHIQTLRITNRESNAFDNALRQAGVADFNLIRVTSIVPPGIPVEHLRDRDIQGKGILMPAVYETISSNKAGDVISCAVGVGISKRESGIIFSYSCKGTKKEVEHVVRKMVAEGMKAKGYSDYYCDIVSASIVVSRNWGCAFASAVFCDKDIEKAMLKPKKQKPGQSRTRRPR